MPSRFARTPRATHVDENDEGEDHDVEHDRARSGAHGAPPWPAGRVRPGPTGRCAARFASPGPAPVLGLLSSIGEMASHLPARGDDDRRRGREDQRGAPSGAPRVPYTRQSRPDPGRSRPRAARSRLLAVIGKSSDELQDILRDRLAKGGVPEPFKKEVSVRILLDSAQVDER